MARAGYESKELRTAEDEVEDLGEEEEEKRLGVVRDDGSAGESHARKVAKSVANEDS